MHAYNIITIVGIDNYFIEVKDMVKAAVRTIFGADASEINALYFLIYCASAGSLKNVLEATPGTAQEFKIKVCTAC